MATNNTAHNEQSMSSIETPDVEDGINYWKTQPASLDGVLGGYGSGSLPRIDSLGSRLFLLIHYPELSTVTSAFRPIVASGSLPKRTRALDVGAGIGRVTADVLLHLVSDVVLLEPVENFVQMALERAQECANAKDFSGQPALSQRTAWKGLVDGSKSVTILQGTLQSFDPLNPHRVKFLDRVGYQPPRPVDDIGAGFDVIWCQWCLGHLNDLDLVAFFRRCHAALRDREAGKSLIMVKENVCSEREDGTPVTVFDEQDSSLTRSDMAWKIIFEKAGLKLVGQELQRGLPEGLFTVKMYALR